jgi:thiol-disulfide isomerase/thioredoxin
MQLFSNNIWNNSLRKWDFVKVLTIPFFLLTTSVFGQLTDQGKYNWEFVMKRVKENNSITSGTKKIITEISGKYNSEEQQVELIEFYKNAYDFKIVDKTVLKNLIDSIATYGLTEEIKTSALEAKNSIEFRLLNKKIKDFNFSDKEGKPISLYSLNSKIVIIELWATWCGPCIEEMPKISELRKLNQSIEFYSISLDKTPEKMKKFVEKQKYDWPIVYGGDEESNEELFEYFHIVAIPKYYIIDKDGIVIRILDKLDEELIRSLK